MTNYVNIMEVLGQASMVFHINVSDNEVLYLRELEELVYELLPRTASNKVSATFTPVDNRVKLPCNFKRLDSVSMNNKKLTQVDFISDTRFGRYVYCPQPRFIELKTSEYPVTLNYYGLPTDSVGNLIIPDIPNLIQALKYKVLYTYLLGGKKHPTLDLQSTTALMQHHMLQAKQQGNDWSESSLEEFTKVILDVAPLYSDFERKYYEEI